ncbi:MAG: Y-family DNA polymerase [Duncaniella sp.]|nr:Y-family DNA polymerase [Duncaniella sp.]MDE7145217.1 Y-family DNA polymerase [Duncaniella sp.]
MLYAICDCDNCFVSCERVFNPALDGKPVVVLSNNDGCVVARSSEAKKLGIKMGLPYYQLRQRFSNDTVIAFSSNYELYADMTARVMSLIRKSVPSFFRYSIDEAFCMLPDMDVKDAKRWGERLSQWVYRSTGMPLSIGIAPNKTLAKIASSFAKNYTGYNHCCMIENESQRFKALSLTDIGDVWGIGRKLATALKRDYILTAADFAAKPAQWVNSRFNVTAQRTWRELNGDDCIPDEQMSISKSITVSRSFAETTSDFGSLRTHVSNFASRCAEKLRRQKSVASTVGVYIVTNRFRDDMPQYGNMLDYPLLTPTDSTVTIVKYACEALKKIYKSGYQYKKAGVILMGIGSHEGIQPDLFEFSQENTDKLHRLDEVIDSINNVQGKDTLIVCSQQYAPKGGLGKKCEFADMIRHDHRSPNPTTRWSDLIKLR